MANLCHILANVLSDIWCWFFVQSNFVNSPENIIRACLGLKTYLAYMKAPPKRRNINTSSSGGAMLQPLPSDIGEVAACVCQVAMWTYAGCEIHPGLSRNNYTALFAAGHHIDLWELLGAKVLDTTKYRLPVCRGMEGDCRRWASGGGGETRGGDCNDQAGQVTVSACMHSSAPAQGRGGGIGQSGL